MQCSGCGYISFKKEKACRSCGFKFKKSTQSSQSLTGKKTFSIFAGSEKDNDNKMMVLIDFDSPEAMKAFGGHEGLKAKRAAAGALLETTEITVMSDQAFTGTS